MQPSALPPPHLPGGREWWTEPPTALPQPEHIEYVVRFACEVAGWRPSQNRNTMQQYLSAWLKAARRLLHEEWHSSQHRDLSTTDGVIVAAEATIRKLCAMVVALGGTIPSDIEEARGAINGRASRIRRERALETARSRSLSPADRKRLGGRS